MIVDMPLSELEQYTPALTHQPDFNAFWQQTLSESDEQALDVTWEEVPYPVERVTVYRVRYNGFGPGTRVAGWYIVPKDRLRSEGDERTPTLVQYHGYSGGKGLPGGYLHWALQGYCVFTIDTRGQDGETPDHAPYPNGSLGGFMTRGIDDPATYYYRYTYIDCVRAIDVARTFPEVGPIVLMGGSQGGGLTLAAAALTRAQGIVAAMPDVPFLCHYQRSLEVFGGGPYNELVDWWKRHPALVQQHLRTLSYFDGMNMAPRIRIPVLMSVALMDTICPPSSGFAVFNHLASTEKTMRVYPYNGHEGGGPYHDEEKYRFVRAQFGKR